MECGSRYPIHTHSRCSKCNGVLDGRYELGGKKFEIGGPVRDSIWQFRDMMPPVSDTSIVSLGEGWTPLIKAPEYGRSIGMESLWCKLEGQNPTGSFKDRAASLAREWRKKGVFVASSGNAAAAVAAYSARAGIQCLVLIREDSTLSKLGQISMYGANLLRVRDIFKSEESLEYALSLAQKSLPDWLNHFIWTPSTKASPSSRQQVRWTRFPRWSSLKERARTQ